MPNIPSDSDRRRSAPARLPDRAARGDEATAREMRDELESHILLRRDALVEQGMDPESAMAEARRRFGDFGAAQEQLIASAKERERQMIHRERLDSFLGDGLHALRRLRRSPGAVTLQVATIAIAVALCCTVFAIVDTVLLKPLPYERSDELVVLQGMDSAGAPVVVISSDNWFDWRAQNRTLAASSIFRRSNVSIVADGNPSMRAAVIAPSDFFDVVRSRMVWGRPYTATDVEQETFATVVSEALWRDLFGETAPHETSITVNGTPMTIVGVMQQGQTFPTDSELWIPYRHVQRGGAARNNINWQGIGRLNAGVSLDAARRDLSEIARRIREAETGIFYSYGVVVERLQDDLVGGYTAFLKLLVIAVAAVLLLACTNLAAANLARAAARAREHAVQLALGSSRGRLAIQLTLEYAFTAIAATLLGSALSIAIIGALPLLGVELPRLAEVRFDGRIALAACVLALLTSLLTAAAPIALLRQASPGRALASGSRGSTRGGGGLAGSWYAAIQVALAVVLVASATFSAMSMRVLLSRPLGFDPSGISMAELLLTTPRFREAPARMAYWDALTQSLRDDGAIEQVALTLYPPLTPGATSFVEFGDRTLENVGAQYNIVGEDFFAVLRTPLLNGRVLDARDDSTQPRVGVINRAFADRYYPGESPIGRTIRVPSMENYAFGGTAPWITIVGVVADARHYGFMADFFPALFVSYRQIPSQTFRLTALVRRRDDARADAQIRFHAARLEPLIAPAITQLDDAMRSSISTQTFTLQLLALFAALALLIAALGVYATLSISVQRRTRELAIRQALGSIPRDLVLLVLRSALGVVTVGALAGAVATIALGDTIRATLFDLAPLNATALAVTILTIILAGTLAAFVPAWRASRVDPSRAMAAE